MVTGSPKVVPTQLLLTLRSNSTLALEMVPLQEPEMEDFAPLEVADAARMDPQEATDKVHFDTMWAFSKYTVSHR